MLKTGILVLVGKLSMISKEIQNWLKEKGIKDTGKYFVSFVEEVIMNLKYKDYVGGRIEIWVDDYPYDIEEIRFFTKDSSFASFRNEWDFKDINTKQLDELEQITKKKYQSSIK